MTSKDSSSSKSTKSAPKPGLASRPFPLLTRLIAPCFAIVTSLIILVILCFSWLPYCDGKSYLLPNIISLFITLALSFAFYQFIKKLHLSTRAFYIIIIPTFILLFIAQIIMLRATYFSTSWDVAYIENLSNIVAHGGSVMDAHDPTYLSMYPNNTFLIAILSLIKTIPIVAQHPFLVLVFNAFLVNLACLFTCLTIKRLVSNKAALLSLLILTPLLIFSPWIIIPYSDTFAILFPILVFYIYTNHHKRWYHYFLIALLSLLGYFIKPTVIFVLVAIIIIELLHNPHLFKSLRDQAILRTRIIPIFCGIILAFCCSFAANKYIDFHELPNVPAATFIHFLAMGENEETCGQYLSQDVYEARNGKVYEFKKFLRRLISRNPIQSAHFFTQKLLVNYNDGTFAWSDEGEVYEDFYYDVPDHSAQLDTILTNYFYKSHDYYAIFTQINQAIWVFILFGCVFIIKSRQSKSILVLELTFLGLFLFLMLFEARARYLFCYAPIIITISILGYHSFYRDILPNLPHKIKSLLK